MKRSSFILPAVLLVAFGAFLGFTFGPAIISRFRDQLPAARDGKGEDQRVVELPVAELANLQVNHQQGSIRFMIGGEPCFFYIQGSDDASRTLATSALISDLQRATTVQIRHERYGIKRRATNFLLFFGARDVPAKLKLQNRADRAPPK